MAVLNSTSPGQLGKYVLPTLEMLEDAMKRGTPVSRGSRPSMILKKTAANVSALQEWGNIGSNSSKQKDALAIPLEVTNTKQKVISIGSIDKPNININFGDMAEAIVGAAICARFIYKNRNITTAQVFGVLYALPPAGKKPGKKGMESTKDFKSANENKKVMDDVNFYLSLSEVNMTTVQNRSNKRLFVPYAASAVRYANSTTVRKWSKLLYENNKYDKIEVVSDGLGGQKTTKVDVFVKVDGKPINIKVSLKAGDVKQFGQVSGIAFEKQTKLWETSFGFGSDIKPLENKYDELITQNKAPEAVSMVYNKVLEVFNKQMRTGNTEDLKRNFAESIKYFATLDEDNVTLLQIGNDAAKLYTFDQIYDAIKGMTLSASITTGKSGLPTLFINDENGQALIQYRVKQEFKSNGSPYIRNYVEKQKGLSKIIGDNL
jgi:hypothetical protein